MTAELNFRFRCYRTPSHQHRTGRKIVEEENKERFAQSPTGAPKGALFHVLFRADLIQPPAMLKSVKGLSRHKREPSHARREIVAPDPAGHASAARRPLPFIPRPLDPFSAWRRSEGVGTKGRRSARKFAAPAESVEQKGMI